jgi:hypothetical protein
LRTAHFVHGPKIVLTSKPAMPLPVVGEVCVECGTVVVKVEDVRGLHEAAGHDHGVQEADF